MISKMYNLSNFLSLFFFLLSWIFLSHCISCTASVKLGSDLLFTEEYVGLLKHKKIGLIANQTSVNSRLELTADLLKKHQKTYRYTLAALFAPEHGIDGVSHAGEAIPHTQDVTEIPIFSLHGKTFRPTVEMLKHVNLLIYDIQDIGSRSYTYVNTLFFVMEEAVKQNIPIIILDRPNPINGLTIDGPIMEEKWRSILGYINLPYCHGMTVGELARYFNEEYKIGCKLHIIPMKGWKRSMTFSETGLTWIPTSPYIPESSTVFYYPTTGIIGELGIVNIGIGYTLPFKLVGAPWINAIQFAETLNAQHFPGVHFQPFYYRPFYGKFAKTDCQGVFIVITNHKTFKPVTTQYLIMGVLKNLYPEEFKKSLNISRVQDQFKKINGTEEVFRVMKEVTHIIWPLCLLHEKEREDFKKRRLKYLLYKS